MQMDAYRMRRIEGGGRNAVEPSMPSSSSDAHIEDLCARLRILCRGPLSAETEAQLRKLAGELHAAIEKQDQMGEKQGHMGKP
jgi:hypothetical protein